jgi:hypothetical protein
VESAATRTDGPLVARFREDVRPFYESLGFEIDEVDGAEGLADSDDESAADGDDESAADSDGEPAADRLRGVLR